MMLYYALYQTKLLPRWIAIWGLLGGILYLISGILPFFDIIKPMSETEALLRMPIAFQEMVMALWLIVRGFNPAATIFTMPRTSST
jgi:uncharacterized membrane protein HdeD (DUF308 family)